jgi:hypothetical protein
MNSTSLNQYSISGSYFGYSAADLDSLGATEYTLATIVVDESSSVLRYKKEMESCIKETVKACKQSPRSDYLLLRVVAFNSSPREIHGFKPLIDCNESDYDNCLKPSGTTRLFATASDVIDATKSYGQHLYDNDFDANAIVFIITDGMDNASGTIDAEAVRDKLRDTMRAEVLESILTILVGVGIGDYFEIDQCLSEFKDKAQLAQYVGLAEADKKTLAKLADFISRSISSQSQALGTGSVSQTLQF